MYFLITQYLGYTHVYTGRSGAWRTWTEGNGLKAGRRGRCSDSLIHSRKRSSLSVAATWWRPALIALSDNMHVMYTCSRVNEDMYVCHNDLDGSQKEADGDEGWVGSLCPRCDFCVCLHSMIQCLNEFYRTVVKTSCQRRKE